MATRSSGGILNGAVLSGGILSAVLELKDEVRGVAERCRKVAVVDRNEVLSWPKSVAAVRGAMRRAVVVAVQVGARSSPVVAVSVAAANLAEGVASVAVTDPVRSLAVVAVQDAARSWPMAVDVDLAVTRVGPKVADRDAVFDRRVLERKVAAGIAMVTELLVGTITSVSVVRVARELDVVAVVIGRATTVAVTTARDLDVRAATRMPPDSERQ